jgi:hypothetical protein
MHNISINFGKQAKNITAPASWNELSRKQLHKVASLLFLLKEDYHKFRIRLTQALTGLKNTHIVTFSPDQLVQLNSLFSFITEENKLTKQLIPSFRVGLLGKRLFGPGDGLAYMSANEFMEADGYYLEYQQTKEMQHLDKLIACLYRPADKAKDTKSESYNGDIRVDFNAHTVYRRAKQIAKLKPATKLAILLWYQGCRSDWEQFFDKVFSEENTESVLHYGWPETIFKLSGSTFGDLKATGAQPMFNILFKMQVDMKDFEEMKRKQDSQKQ